MRNPKPILFVVSAVIALVLAIWFLAPGAGEDPLPDEAHVRELHDAVPVQPRPTHVKRLPGSEAPNEPAPSARSEGSPPDRPVDEAPSDRPPPASPAEEGLFALADASGKSVVRCPLDAFPEGFEPSRQDVVVDGIVSRMVQPNTDDGPSSPTLHLGEIAFSMTTIGAFPGTIGTCEIAPHEGFALKLTPEEADQLGASIDKKSLDALDDADEAMLPAQVALDEPDLSDGARASLQARLDAAVDQGEAVLERPTDGAEILDANYGEMAENGTPDPE